MPMHAEPVALVLPALAQGCRACGQQVAQLAENPDRQRCPECLRGFLRLTVPKMFPANVVPVI